MTTEKRRLPTAQEIDEQLNHSLPFNESAEECLTACAMVDADLVLPAVLHLVDPSQLIDPHIAPIFSSIVDLWNRGIAVEPETVATECVDREVFADQQEACQAMARLYFDTVPNPSSAVWYAMHVQKAAMRRSLNFTGFELLRDTNKAGSDPGGILASAEASLREAGRLLHANRPIKASEAVAVALERAKSAKEGSGGLATGFGEVDRLLGGLKGGQLIIVAARPSVGKSAFAANVAYHAASHHCPVLFVAMEMRRHDIGERLLANVASVDLSKIQDNNLSDEEQEQIVRAQDRLHGAPLTIHDDPNMRAIDVAAHAQAVQQASGLGLIIVDYLTQLIPADLKAPREQQVSGLSRDLKKIAMQLDVPLIACAQLNREVEKREKNKLPRLSDLRESGAIEQDADMVLFLHRTVKDETGEASVLVSKNRNGRTGVATLQWNGPRTRFENRAAEHHANYSQALADF